MENRLISRLLNRPAGSFLLLGPRGVGKTTWIRENFSKALRFDLLHARQFLDLSKDPSLLESKIGEKPRGTWIVIDEIQKVPLLLDEVHRLMEEKGYKFALTGSSARKLRRSGANLLAGRAITKTMLPLTSAEWPQPFKIDEALLWGGLPLAVFSEEPADFLETYFHTYIKEEIREEGLVRQIEPFIRFLEITGNINAQVLNVENIARDAGAKRVTVDKWFEILEDTLVATRLTSWRPGFKVRESAHPKFYWFDPGVARVAAGRIRETPDSSWLGWSLETWIFHELRAYNHYSNKNKNLYYYGLPSGLEVDFVIELNKGTPSRPPSIIGIEVKMSKRWKREWETPLRDIADQKNINVEKMFGIYTGDETLDFKTFKVYPVAEFLRNLYQGKIF